ncbi:HU family DNA-binding protein [Ramlibacter rhizophilus]|uniref:HU family DNA-binding protein n=1 Tax=Ramlibacter rhizophilus TaxID=1781167 RepID=A0A4Z0C2C3_9BURK|nr:HU family DNA-binding protein [Ramlibacter rhizophilus]TFZ04375.1 HU family DNA-binding protein [Ramlibacter rhizophilus]
MKKGELVEALAQATGESQAAAAKHLDAFIEVISQQMASGDEVTITGFGSFKASKRAARTGRNPSTGAAMEIPESTAVRFTPGAKLKAAVNGQ